jgi:F-type H+-transporting ATPase subunit b
MTKTLSRNLVIALAVLVISIASPSRSTAAEEQSAEQSSTEPNSAQQGSVQQSSAQPGSSQPSAEQNNPPSASQELIKESREAAGEEPEEENASLKHARPVRWLARKIEWSVHGTHLLLSILNFAIIALATIWALSKFLPGIFRERNSAIRHALDEARAASADANRRLSEIENRLRELDSEIGRMQASAEKEASAEEERIKRATEEDVRKIVTAAEQEIVAAAKQARRELAAHTASLAISLARNQIRVDPNTDQVLVRTFASGLGLHPELRDDNHHGGKDGR